MFDIGFAELLIIAVVGLLVIGPERLPGAIRTGSAWLNRFRRGFNEIRQEVQQELHNDAVMRELREGSEKLRRETESLKRDFDFSDGSPLNPAAESPTAGSKAGKHGAAEEPQETDGESGTPEGQTQNPPAAPEDQSRP